MVTDETEFASRVTGVTNLARLADHARRAG